MIEVFLNCLFLYLRVFNFLKWVVVIVNSVLFVKYCNKEIVKVLFLVGLVLVLILFNKIRVDDKLEFFRFLFLDKLLIFELFLFLEKLFEFIIFKFWVLIFNFWFIIFVLLIFIVFKILIICWIWLEKVDKFCFKDCLLLILVNICLN